MHYNAHYILYQYVVTTYLYLIINKSKQVCEIMKGPGPKNYEIKHIRKLTSNINGLTMYFVLAIPLHENFNALKALRSLAS